MTFNLREILGGKPRYLYTFMRANSVWRLTNVGSPVTVVATGVTFEPAIITHGRMERSQELRADSIAVRVGRTTPIADALREVRMHPILLRIEKHQPADSLNVPIVLAFGDVAGVRLVDGFIEFDCVSGESRFGEPFPSKFVERQSQWGVFSAQSGIDERQFSYVTTITHITRSVVTVADIGIVQPGYYDIGQLKLGAGADAERVFIDHHIGADLYLSGKLPDGVANGDTVTLVAGNDNMLTTWRDKFGPDAVDRFSGFDLVPTTDPLQTGLDTTGIARTPYAGDVTSPASPLRIYPRTVETATDATVSANVIDPTALMASIEYRSNPTGSPGDWTGWADMPILAGTLYGATVAKVAGFIEIQVRVTKTDTTVATGTWVFNA